MLLLLAIAVSRCTSARVSDRFVNVHVQPAGTFSNYSPQTPEQDALIVRVIDVTEAKRAYQVVLQGVIDGGVTRTLLVDAEWENSARTECDQITFEIPAVYWHEAARFVGCAHLDRLDGTITFARGTQERVTLKRHDCE